MALWLCLGLALGHPEASAVVMDEATTDAPEVVSSFPPTVAVPSDKARYVPGQLIVKYKDSVTECAHCLLAAKKAFRLATTDASASLDLLNAKYKVTSAKPVFRTLLEEQQIVGPKTISALKQYHQTKDVATKQKFLQRAQRAPQGAVKPDTSHVYLLEVAAAADMEALAREFAQDAHVAYAQPNYVARVQAQPLPSVRFIPNDEYVQNGSNWREGAFGQAYPDLWGLWRIQALEAWDQFTDPRNDPGRGVLVAVIDSGIDYNHPEIAANMWINAADLPNTLDDDHNGWPDDYRGFDLVNSVDANRDGDYDDLGDILGTPWDDNGHGTHVAGTIAAVRDNGIGIAGVAPKAKLMTVKAFDREGAGDFANLAAAMDYAINQGADVINNSWGCESPCPLNPVVEEAVRRAWADGVVVVFSAGNNGTTNDPDIASYSPQNMPEVIVVSSSDHENQPSDFSNEGLLDVAAPGGDSTPPTTGSPYAYNNVLSLRAANSDLYCPGTCGPMVVNTNYYRARGTSMAAPHVAGVAALLLSKYPALTVEQVRQAIRRGADDVGPAGFDRDTGAGRLNARLTLAESAPSTALITTPSLSAVTGVASVAIRGIAGGPNFSTWRLERENGTLLASSTTPLGGEGLLTNWNISAVPDGAHTLRLVVRKASGEEYEDRHRVVIDQIVVTDPAPVAVSGFRSGQTISIRGTAAPANFDRYSITIQRSDGTSVTSGISLTNGGSLRVYQGLLGTWDTSGRPAGHYTISLNVRFFTATGTSTISEQTRVIVDPTLQAGWPKPLGAFLRSGSGPFTLQLALTDHLNAADLDGDGNAELLIGYGNSIRVFDHTGERVQDGGWPRRIDTMSRDAVIFESPSVADLTGDGVPEVAAVNSAGELFLWDAQGTLVAGWPKALQAGKLAIADLDGNGTLELITTDSPRGWVRVFDAAGTPRPGWPQRLDAALNVTYRDLSAPAIGDLDRDGKMEIAVAVISSEFVNQPLTGPVMNLYVLHSNGTVLPGWPKALSLTLTSSPAIGDLDGDGDLEIVINASDDKIYAFHHTGSPARGWPQSTSPIDANPAAIGDLDGDGTPEIIAGGKGPGYSGSEDDNYLFAWHGDGRLVTGWPVQDPLSQPIGYSRFFGFGAPTLADLDGNGTSEVVASSDAGSPTPFALRAYQHNGTELAEFPKPTSAVGAWPTNTAAVANLDDDASLELAWIDLNNNLFFWDLPAAATAAQPWPMFRHDARHTGTLPPANPNAPVLWLMDPDVTDDGPVGGADIGKVVGAFGSANPGADVNGDGMVAAGDITLVVAAFGTVNWPPFNSATSRLSWSEGKALSLFLTANDPNGDSLAFPPLDNPPAGAILTTPSGTNPNRRQFAWTPSFTQAGTYTVRFRANESSGTWSSAPIDLYLTITNTLLAITSLRDFGPNNAEDAAFNPSLSQTTRVEALFNQPVTSWTLQIKGPAPSTSLVRSFSYSGTGVTALSQVWNGKYASGARVPAGTYTYSVSATAAPGSSGGSATRSGTVTVQ